MEQIIIQDFMVNELNLISDELLIYAIIYSQKKIDNLETLGKIIGKKKIVVQYYLNELIKKGLIQNNTDTEFYYTPILPAPTQIQIINIDDNTFNFETFFNLYPRKDDKGKAEKIFTNLIKSSLDKDELLKQIKTGVLYYSEIIKEYNIKLKYLKKPNEWLSRECWKVRYDLNDPLDRFYLKLSSTLE